MESLSVKILQRFSTWSVFLISFSLILNFIGYDITTYIPIFILLFAIFVIINVVKNFEVQVSNRAIIIVFF